MFVIRNEGRFPVVVRDLNYHIQGGKSIDLDLVFRRETSEASVDLKNLIKCKKVFVLNKDQYASTKQNIVQQSAVQTVSKEEPLSNNVSPLALTELLKEIRGMKDLLAQGNNISSSNDVVQDLSQYDDATRQKIADLQARSLSQKDNEVEKNFENIGNVTEKTDSGIGNMLDILDSLEND
jgi:hypothetical protein